MKRVIILTFSTLLLISCNHKEKDLDLFSLIVMEHKQREQEASDIHRALGENPLLTFSDVERLVLTFYQVKLWKLNEADIELDYIYYNYKKVDINSSSNRDDVVKIIGDDKYIRDGVDEKKTEEAIKVIEHLESIYLRK